MINERDMDTLVYEIMRECSNVVPPLSNIEIRQIAIEQLELQMKDLVEASLHRLVLRGLVVGAQDARASLRPRYEISPASAA
jgi:hypothetical protein